jgi:hypothetical protein
MAKIRTKILLQTRVEYLLQLARRDQRAAKGQKVLRKRRARNDFNKNIIDLYNSFIIIILKIILFT